MSSIVIRARRCLFVWAGLCAWACCSAAVAAGAMVDSQGFENPPFELGALSGQQGWMTAGTGGGAAVVQGSVVLSGSQAVRVDRGANSDDRWGMPVAAGFPRRRHVLVDWDMRVEQAAAGGFGPLFAVDAFDADPNVALLGSLGVDATTGDILYQEQDTGFLLETGFAVNRGAWNHFQMILDYQLQQYQVLVNGTVLGTTGFVDRGLGVDGFTDSNILATTAAGDPTSLALTGTAFVDNFLVRDGLAGDLNDDLMVDAADFDFWKTRLGDNVTAGTGADANGDGVVTAADYTVWRDNLGATASGSLASGSGQASATVPEPGCVSLVLLAAGAVLAGWRRRSAVKSAK